MASVVLAALAFMPSGAASAGTTEAEGSRVRVARQVEPLAELEVGARPVWLVEAGGAVWVANTDDGTLSRLEPEGAEGLLTASLGGDEKIIGLAAAGGSVFAKRLDSGELDQVDAETGELLRSLPDGSDYGGLSGSGDRVWHGSSQGLLLGIDPRTGVIVERLELAPVETYLDVVADERGAWVLGGGSMWRIDRGDEGVEASGPWPADVGEASLVSDGERPWAISVNGSVFAFDTAAGAFSPMFELRRTAFVSRIAEGSLWTRGADHVLLRTSLADGSVEDAIELPRSGEPPGSMLIEGDQAWIANSGQASVWLISLTPQGT